MKTITKGELFQKTQELRSFWETGPGLLFDARLAEFFNDNSVAVDSIEQAHRDLTEAYFVLENGAIKIEERDGKAASVLQEGKTMEDYETEVAALFAEEVDVII